MSTLKFLRSTWTTVTTTLLPLDAGATLSTVKMRTMLTMSQVAMWEMKVGVCLCNPTKLFFMSYVVLMGGPLIITDNVIT